jgi:hypothetical protein
MQTGMPTPADTVLRPRFSRKGNAMDASASGDLTPSRRNLLRSGAGVAGAVALGVGAAAPATAAVQSGWRWCNRYQCLFYGGKTTTGWCPRGGGHDYGGSGKYSMAAASGSGEDNWRWCRDCQAMWYAGFSSAGRCPAGGGHVLLSSGDYFIKTKGGAQPGWRWCSKCYCLAYSGRGNGRCASGNGQDCSKSKKYFLDVS